MPRVRKNISPVYSSKHKLFTLIASSAFGLSNSIFLRDTQVPQLRTFVHETTAPRYCETFSKNFVNNTSDMLDRVKLLATDAANVPSGRSSIRCMPSFEAEVNTLVEKIQPIVDHFMKNAEQRVKRTLKPSLKAGAAKGSASVMDTGASWGSTNRR
jgi:hypothetical protein